MGIRNISNWPCGIKKVSWVFAGSKASARGASVHVYWLVECAERQRVMSRRRTTDEVGQVWTLDSKGNNVRASETPQGENRQENTLLSPAISSPSPAISQLISH
jgi:hypothetical protein